MSSRAHRLIKGAVLNFARSPGDIRTTVGNIISRGKQVQDLVANQPKPTFSNTVAPLANFENDQVTFLQNVSADKSVRDASSEAEQQLGAFRIESLMREDVYKSVRAVFDNKAEMTALEPEDRLLVEKMEEEYRRNGLALSAENRDKLGHIRKRLSELSITFSRNTNENDGRILFTRQELGGLPEDYFDGRTTEVVDGVEKFVVTTKYPDLVPTLLATEESRCPENIALLQEAIGLRVEAARLLGYTTHAEFVLKQNMAKTPQAVLEFEHDLRNKLDVLADKEIKEIEALKRADNKAVDAPYEGLFNWDFRYYSNQVKERKHKYFPMKQVTRGVLDIYQKMLSLRFVKATNDDFVGHFYLDLYPRDGKYNHACVNPIRAGFAHPDGSREYPVAVMLANFPKPTSAAPALLTHDDTLTLLHEFGHVFHHICAETKWSHFQLDSVQMDFIEAPSQMLENWGWEPSVLRQFAVHHKTGEPIPEDLVKRLVAAKNEGAGLFNLRQVFFGLFDMAIHNTADGNVDVKAVYRELREKTTHGTCGAATFGHMMGGYDAGYYGYLWAKVFSSDMYASRFLKDGVDNPQTGLDYRREILLPGGSRDASAFLESIGLAEQQA
ncbi:hypothetical protein BX661DRAFT_182988 [Kickxella alabastrina]|uniref:uncharacterized protein n=1 Tax=Kickxella alabastrina TaxID=61397 RepID=UPI00221F665F|nr:uncharacterized protein BX661DRAFT_182988 [Kickxella alabastrina]KAI7827287.1 hypothetical protein BX661DRAFT_182988 [Kickxella alabastrina]